MIKIYTIRNLDDQQFHMWDASTVEEEVKSCSARNICDFFNEYLPKNEPILEAGCGLGAWVIYLQSKGYNIAGIDHDEKVLGRINDYDSTLDVKLDDICKIDCPDNHFGAYISLGVVEHFEEGPEKPLSEAWRILRPGGIIILTVPFNNIFRKIIANQLRYIYMLIQRLKGNESYFAEYRYSETEVSRMIKNAGFNVLKTDIDDFKDKNRSLGIWSEFPFLQSKKEPYSLNFAGKIFSGIMNAISRKTIASGILTVAIKPLSHLELRDNNNQ